VLLIDESPTKQGRLKAWVWTFVAATYTFFACRTSRAAEVPCNCSVNAMPASSTATGRRMYWAFGRLQWLAHLKRDFQALIDSPCTIRKRLGHDLMRPTKELFALWQKVRDGTMSRREFRRQMETDPCAGGRLPAARLLRRARQRLLQGAVGT